MDQATICSSSARLLLATSNQGKLEEFRRLLLPAGIDLLSLNDISLNDIGPEAQRSGRQLYVEENAPDFAGNASLKAKAGWRLTGLPCLADDSGLAVDALDGRPGLLSARYGGPNLTSTERCQLLLKEMETIPEERRSARFICLLAFCSLQGEISLFEGRVEGAISGAMRGEGGFGYDPIFLDLKLKRSFAELTAQQKDAHSHRGSALRKFIAAYSKGPISLGQGRAHV